MIGNTIIDKRLKLVTAPSSEPVTLAETLAQCHADSGTEDAWFTSTIKVIRTIAENYQWRSYITTTWDYTIDDYPEGNGLYLPRSPLLGVTSIKTYDQDDVETTLTLSDFRIDTSSDPGFITIKDSKSWPTTSLRETSGIVIRFTAGYGATAASVPEDVKHAILLGISWAYENRAGEVPIPKAFYDILYQTKVHYMV